MQIFSQWECKFNGVCVLWFINFEKFDTVVSNYMSPQTYTTDCKSSWYNLVVQCTLRTKIFDIGDLCIYVQNLQGCKQGQRIAIWFFLYEDNVIQIEKSWNISNYECCADTVLQMAHCAKQLRSDNHCSHVRSLHTSLSYCHSWYLSIRIYMISHK